MIADARAKTSGRAALAYAAALGLATRTSGRGVVCADFDHDGDTDLLELTEARGNSARLWENRAAAALEHGIVLREGVYVAVPGPNLETRAEYRMLRAIGADVVGMSTVPEVIVAVHEGMRVIGISIITDQCLPDALEPADIERIIATATRAEPQLTRLVRAVVERLT